MSTDNLGRARVERWRGASEVLAETRRHPGLTRVELARRLTLPSASASEVVARLRGLGWLTEQRAPISGRGRPTSVLGPDPAGPVVLAVDLRHEDWRCAVAGLDGHPTEIVTGRHANRAEPAAVIDEVRPVVTRLAARREGRVVAIGVAAPVTVADSRFAQAAVLGWDTLDVARLAPSADVPVLFGNDATLAGVAEARTGTAAGAATALYLTVEVGIGGALIVDGRPLTGARGGAGEFGHLPFGVPGRRCPCGSSGCWDLEVDGRALARHLGEPEPADPRTLAQRVLARAGAGEPAALAAVTSVVGILARGIAGLVNAHDPEVVVLGGLAPALRATAPAPFTEGYTDGLMRVHRDNPPPVHAATHREDATLRGAAAIALDHATSPAALAALAERSGAPDAP